MADRLMKQFLCTLEAGVAKLYGEVTTTTSGTIGTTAAKGFTVAKTAGETGRYTVTLADKYVKLLHCGIVVVGSADAAYTSAKGLVSFLRNDTVSAGGKTFDIQFCDADGSAADAELEDGAKFKLEVTLKNSTAY
jgi:hypothetical protein